MCKQTDNTPFLFLFFADKLWPFLVFFRIVVSVMLLEQKQKASFTFVGWCMIDTV